MFGNLFSKVTYWPLPKIKSFNLFKSKNEIQSLEENQVPETDLLKNEIQSLIESSFGENKKIYITKEKLDNNDPDLDRKQYQESVRYIFFSYEKITFCITISFTDVQLPKYNNQDIVENYMRDAQIYIEKCIKNAQVYISIDTISKSKIGEYSFYYGRKNTNVSDSLTEKNKKEISLCMIEIHTLLKKYYEKYNSRVKELYKYHLKTEIEKSVMIIDPETFEIIEL